MARENDKDHNKPEPIKLTEKIVGFLVECKDGNHKLEEIGRHRLTPPGGMEEVSEILRWCKNCGSVVGDIEVDGRIQPGRVMKIRGPEISKWAFGYIKATQK